VDRKIAVFCNIPVFYRCFVEPSSRGPLQTTSHLVRRAIFAAVSCRCSLFPPVPSPSRPPSLLQFGGVFFVPADPLVTDCRGFFPAGEMDDFFFPPYFTRWARFFPRLYSKSHPGLTFPLSPTAPGPGLFPFRRCPIRVFMCANFWCFWRMLIFPLILFVVFFSENFLAQAPLLPFSARSLRRVSGRLRETAGRRAVDFLIFLRFLRLGIRSLVVSNSGLSSVPAVSFVISP